MSEILIIRRDSCLDVPYLEPFLKNLEKAFKDISLTWITVRDDPSLNKTLQAMKFRTSRVLAHGKRNPADLFKIMPPLLKKKYDFVFILDGSFFSRFLSLIVPARKRVAFRKCFLDGLFSFISVERDCGEYLCDQFNYLLQKAEIQTPSRNPEPVRKDPFKPCNPECPTGDYVLLVCGNCRKEEEWVKEMQRHMNIEFRCVEVRDPDSSPSLESLVNQISMAQCVVFKEVPLYAGYSLYCRKAVLVCRTELAVIRLFRLLSHFYVAPDDRGKLLNILNERDFRQEFFDFRKNVDPGIEKILVLKTGGLGDLILSYPTVSLIRKAWPAARITALVIPYMLQLAKYNKDFDEVIAYDKQKKKDFGYIFRLGKTLRDSGYDAFFLLNRSPRVVMLAWLSGIKTVVGYGSFLLRPFIRHPVFEKDRRKYKVLLQNIDIARGIGLDVDEVRYGSYSVEKCTRIEEFIEANRQGRKIVTVNVGGRWPSKKFKPSKWSALIDALEVKYGVPVFLLWGPDEREIVDEVYAGVRDKSRVFILPSTNMGEVAYAISRSLLFLTSDTGAMHIADALKIPQVVLMGPTSPVRWGPVSPKSRIIYRKVPCGPCNTEVCKDHDNLCMAQLKPEEILLEINAMELDWQG